MSGAIHPLPQYVFMALCLIKSTGTTLPLSLPCILQFAIEADGGDSLVGDSRDKTADTSFENVG
jgi:hypothetical protein